ncbi:hypothetical protein CXG81DRAFT_19275 [Caulochytrium protostelioides]|uniref:Uncharacterized protein n=1 Tax=Caulochytrium protostelioides TaxID=1555241 RepID=A0A4P9X6N1_9FUNG|nr:hypothetical protein CAUPRSCDRAFT_11884 [Caulochytrium protostelioides]RKP00835.1 hypothetical protein CXG81DRAFT_19275 [Caulochytrium protostelioides]|eukprot:RKP00835.1 hypothetical protein CXG81DRAFT_19275 [Caulochytrium protostelioides]
MRLLLLLPALAFALLVLLTPPGVAGAPPLPHLTGTKPKTLVRMNNKLMSFFRGKYQPVEDGATVLKKSRPPSARGKPRPSVERNHKGSDVSTQPNPDPQMDKAKANRNDYKIQRMAAEMEHLKTMESKLASTSSAAQRDASLRDTGNFATNYKDTRGLLDTDEESIHSE